MDMERTKKNSGQVEMATKLLDAAGTVIKCSETVFSGGRGWHHRCSADATVMRHSARLNLADSERKAVGDVPYCTIHDPERRRALRDRRDAEQRAEGERKTRSREVIKAGLLKRILAGVENETDAEKLFDDVSGYGYRMARGY
jgi:DNA primase catalytic subunit